MGPPSGTVTFLFTDIEGSTGLWESAPDAMRAALASHDAILRDAIEAHGGYVFATGGDGFAAAFARAGDALAAAEKARTALANEEWPAAAPIRVRMALHTGEATERDGNYFGGAVNRAARLMAVGHGGQLLVSAATAELLTGAELVDLGEHRLRDLDRPLRVFQVGSGSFGTLRSLDAFPGNLPRQVTSFVGREGEVAAVVAALADSPLVTLTGVGGVGKTRLALQAAAEALPSYRDGAWLVELGPVRDGNQVADAHTAVFSLSVGPGTTPVDALVDFLRNKQLLLVVDNCEHVIGAAAALVSTVVASCNAVAVLATSREGLALAGERIIAVPSLGAPAPDAAFDAVAASEAVRLFVDRATAVDATFALTPANTGAVATVCRRLDGIPLAIELAAARVPTMSPVELANRLDHRFRVLAGGRRGAVERHQTLRAAIDWSYELLTEAEQALLARLSVFAGGCTLGAAEAVCAGHPVGADDVLDLLASLVARSLVVAGRDGPVTRYRLLETIRQYGEERLDPDEADSLRARHAEHYAQVAEGFFVHLWGEDQVEWYRRVAADGENLMAAMNWAVDTDNADIGLRIGASVYAMLQLGFAVTIPAETALALSGAAEHPLYPMALAKAAFEAAERSDRQIVEERSAQALDAERRLGGPSRGLLDAWVCAAQATVDMNCGFFEAAAEQYQRAGELAVTASSLGFGAQWLSGAAAVGVGGEDNARAIDNATRSLALARQSGAPLTTNQALTALASALARSEPVRAATLLAEAIDVLDALGSEYPANLTQATIVAARLGDWPLTLRLAHRAIPLMHWTATLPYLLGLLHLTALALSEVQPEAAARLQGAAHAIAAGLAADPSQGTRPTVVPPSAGFVTELRREATRRLSSTLTQERLDELRREGNEMRIDNAVAYALAEIDTALAFLSSAES